MSGEQSRCSRYGKALAGGKKSISDEIVCCKILKQQECTVLLGIYNMKRSNEMEYSRLAEIPGRRGGTCE